jgi:hypothetical protein
MSATSRRRWWTTIGSVLADKRHVGGCRIEVVVTNRQHERVRTSRRILVRERDGRPDVAVESLLSMIRAKRPALSLALSVDEALAVLLKTPPPPSEKKEPTKRTKKGKRR